jgi:hypothetical protein
MINNPFPGYIVPGVYGGSDMALTIKGTPQKVSELAASLHGVSKGSQAQGAVKAAKDLEDQENKKRGGAHGKKSR